MSGDDRRDPAPQNRFVPPKTDDGSDALIMLIVIGMVGGGAIFLKFFWVLPMALAIGGVSLVQYAAAVMGRK